MPRIPRSFGHLVPASLPVVVRAYTATVTRLTGRPPVWQRGYYESMRRTASQIARARDYVNGHPHRS